MTEIKELIEKANEQCKRIKDYITENKGMFSSMDLKLHDASFYEFGKMENDFPMCFKENEDRSCGYTYFYDFCEDRYDQFKEWCEEEKINFMAMCHHIGSTSSFYLYEKELIERNYGEISWSWTMGNIFDELAYPSSSMVEFDLNGDIDEWIVLRASMNSDNEALFLTKKGSRVTESAIKELFKYNGNGITPHMMRHWYATFLGTTGNIAFAQQQLRHTSMTTTVNNYSNGAVGMKEMLKGL
ncbi:tyrosine-type recombinase/integrase [Eubacterium ramulus]|uniref:tyrosine-type recombinase/integrase n=1 Tax=Eubacterium ramulus TaxID=39490 RepID=UPI00399BCF72